MKEKSIRTEMKIGDEALAMVLIWVLIGLVTTCFAKFILIFIGVVIVIFIAIVLINMI